MVQDICIMYRVGDMLITWMEDLTSKLSSLYIYYSFKESIKSSKDRVDLALFLNNWSSYATTIELLKEQMNKPDFNKEEALLLAQTYPLEIDDNGSSDADLESILKKVYRLNKKDWCQWQKDNKNIKH